METEWETGVRDDSYVSSFHEWGNFHAIHLKREYSWEADLRWKLLGHFKSHRAQNSCKMCKWDFQKADGFMGLEFKAEFRATNKTCKC